LQIHLDGTLNFSAPAPMQNRCFCPRMKSWPWLIGAVAAGVQSTHPTTWLQRGGRKS